MRAQFVIPVLASILILATLAYFSAKRRNKKEFEPGERGFVGGFLGVYVIGSFGIIPLIQNYLA